MKKREIGCEGIIEEMLGPLASRHPGIEAARQRVM